MQPLYLEEKMRKTLLSLTLLASFGAAHATGTGNIYVSSEDDNAVIVLDGTSYAKLASIKTSDRPRHLAFSPDRKFIYAACGEGDAIDVIDVAKGEVVKQLDVGEDPEAFDISPDGKRLYVSMEDDGELAIFDLERNETIGAVEVGEEPEGVLAHPNGKTVYVTSEEANLVHVVNVESGELEANILVGNRPRRFALDTSRNELWVTNEISGTVSIIDTEANAVKVELKFEPKGFRSEDVTPVGITMTADFKTAYVTLGHANHVAVVDIAKRAAEDYILVGKRAWGLALDRAEKRLFVANGKSDDLSIIDTASHKVLKSVPVARVPYGVLIDD
jgi:PQQ-dependent catabolism-associated beta-propeller protein